MIEKIFLVGLDEELIILSKKIGLNLSGVIDIDENAKHKELSIYQENFLMHHLIKQVKTMKETTIKLKVAKGKKL